MTTEHSNPQHEAVRPTGAEGSSTAEQRPSGLFSDVGLPPGHTMMEYAIDTWQRSVLYADVMRQRGNRYQAHLTEDVPHVLEDRKSTRLNSSHVAISYAVFCLKK